MRLRLWAEVLWLAVCCCPALAAGHQNPCAANPTQPGWRVFVENKNRFCFEYPSQYQIAQTVIIPVVSTGPAKKFFVRLATRPVPVQVASADDEANANIDVFTYDQPFSPANLTRMAPTGMEDVLPKLIHTAHQDFYYYGPGSGGVDYPDAYYFGLQGNTFSIHFFGPYDGDKTLAAVTKQIEPKLLASFRRF